MIVNFVIGFVVSAVVIHLVLSHRTRTRFQSNPRKKNIIVEYPINEWLAQYHQWLAQSFWSGKYSVKKKGVNEMKMYELTDAFQELYVNDELTDEEVENKLQALNMELEEKCSNGIALIQTLKAAVEGMKAEEMRLKQRRTALENKIGKIKDYYQAELTAIGKTKILTSRGTMTVAKSGGKMPMKIDDENLVPQNFKKIVYEIDKDKLREALEDGEIISGAHLEERGSYLKIS